MTVNDLVRELREVMRQHKVTQGAIAKVIGAGQTSVSRWLREQLDDEPVQMEEDYQRAIRQLLDEVSAGRKPWLAVAPATEPVPDQLQSWLIYEASLIRRELSSENERSLAIEIRSAAIRAVALAEAERAAFRRADAIALEARRALLTCRASRGVDGKGPTGEEDKVDDSPDNPT